MKKKITLEQNLHDFKKVHGDKYDYSEVKEILNSKTKIIIICKIHNHKFSMNVNNHKNGQGCKKCKYESRPKLSLEQNIIDFKSIHGDKYDYSTITNFINTKQKIQIKCKTHNILFWVTPDNHKRGKGCIMCANLKRGPTRITNEVIDRKISNKRIKRLENVIDSLTPIKWKCEKPHCGHIWKTTPNSLAGCPKCARNLKLTDSDVDKRLLDRNIKRLSSVNGVNSKIKFVCQKNHIWTASLSSVINGGSGCPRCKTSRGQTKIETILTKLKIHFETEKRFQDCKCLIPLPFDFYLPDYNTCIEYDGEQHFDLKFWKRFGLSDRECRQKFDDQLYRDELKTKFCRKNSIKLIRIKYSDSIEDVLLESLNFIIL